MDKHYTLTSKSGIYTAVGSAITTIGQVVGCDIMLPNNTGYEDVIFAKIAPDKDCLGWHIIKVTPYYAISINGAKMNWVHYLSDGDSIELGGEIYRFNIRQGENTVPSVTHIHGGGKLLMALAAAVVIIAAIVAYRIYDSQRECITESMQAKIEDSLYTIRVDSLHLVFGDSIVDTYTYASSPTGTAFLTTDSMLVTARHCVQPWLNRVLPHEYSIIPRMSEKAIAMALYAETENQYNGIDNWRIVSFLTFSNENGDSFICSSDEFDINRELDEIVELGAYDEIKYWRSISHRYSRREMMLGDIAAAKFSKAGNISMADNSDIKKLLAGRGVKMMFYGYPESGVNGNVLENRTDELRLPISETTIDGQEHIFMLAHEGSLTHGFSGGPAIVRSGAGFKAVGVISVIDERNGNRSYSVPTSEVYRLKRK